MLPDNIQQVLQQEYLNIPDMALVLNYYRDENGHKPITITWLRELCSKQAERAEKGLLFLPAIKLTPGRNAHWYVPTKDFQELLPKLLEMATTTGRRSKAEIRKSKGIKIHGSGFFAAPHETPAWRFLKPPEDVNAAAQSVVNHLSGWRPHDDCSGQGCEGCHNGWVQASRPYYNTREMVKQNDVVQVPFQMEYPTAFRGVVRDFNADGTIFVYLVDNHFRVIPESDCAFDIKDLVLIQRGLG